MRKLLIILISLFFFNLFCNSILFSRQIPFDFKGNVIFIPSEKGKNSRFITSLNIFNLKLKGKLEIEILNTSPLELKISSKKIHGNVGELIKLLKRLNINTSYFKNLSGKLIIKNLILNITGNNYSFSIENLIIAKSSFYKVNGSFSKDSIVFRAKKLNIYLKNLIIPLKEKNFTLNAETIAKNLEVIIKDKKLTKIDGEFSNSKINLTANKVEKITIKSPTLKVFTSNNLINFSTSILKISTKNLALDEKEISLNSSLSDLSGNFNVNSKILSCSFTLKTDGSVKLNNYASLNIKKLISKISINGDKYRISSLKMDSIFNRDGVVKIEFSGEIHKNEETKNLKKAIFKIFAKNLKYRNFKIHRLDIEKSKENYGELNFKGDYDGLLFNGDANFTIYPDKISIISHKLNLNDTSKEEYPLVFKFPDIIKKISKIYHIEIDRLTYKKAKTDIEIDSLTGEFIFDKIPVFSSNFYLCNLLVAQDIGFYKDKTSVIIEVKAISQRIDNLISCFTTEAPVYITGSSNIQLNISTYGKKISDFRKNSEIDGLITLENGAILKISNIDKKLGFILKLLKLIKLNKSRLNDAIEYKKIILPVSKKGDTFYVKNIQLISNIFDLTGKLNYDLKKKKMKFSGIIKKGILEKHFEVEKEWKK